MHRLLIALEELRLLLNASGDKMNTIEAYSYFLRASADGPNCSYAQKCKIMFKETIYANIKEKIEEINSIIQEGVE